MSLRSTKIILTLLFLSTVAFSQTAVKLSLEPYAVTPFMVALSTTDSLKFPYTGLQNVGIGTRVFLKAEINGKKFGTVTYTFTRKPSGAKAAIDTKVSIILNDSTQVVFFTADLAGTYAVRVNDGVYSSSELVINAAKYIGFTNTVVNGVDTKVNCSTCHAEKVAGWLKTNHATMFTRAMSATPGISGPADHYSTSCVKCHTTGYDANPTAVNDGFDDLGFVYPTTITSATYKDLVTKYPAPMLRANIQCESCHGPASAHLGVTSDKRIDNNFNPDACAYCHESGTNHIIAREFRYAAHATNELDGDVIDESGAGRESCVRCHTGKGFVQFVDKIPTTDPYFDPSFSPITCAGCHDPHGKDNDYQLRTLSATILTRNATTPTTPLTMEVKGAGLGTLCINCHQSRREAYSTVEAAFLKTATSVSNSHYGAQGDVLLSNNMIELGGVKLEKSLHLEITEDACVRCHMYNDDGRLDPNKNLIRNGGHTFAMREPHPVDAKGEILKDAIGDLVNGKANMNPCQVCHGSTLGADFKDVRFFYNGNGDLDNNGVVEGLQGEVKGMIMKIMQALVDQIPGTTRSTSTGFNTAKGFFGFPTSKNTWTKDQMSAYWNAYFVYNDKSLGIHNPKYIVSGLRGAMKALGLATAVDKEEAIPTTFALQQNYPNPFNPSTTIKFSIPKNTHVKLTVYDILGKELEVLVNNELVAGTHNIQWNARDLASGIYLYRLETKNFVKTNKMLLIK